MRTITENALRRSRAARRNHLRRSHLGAAATPVVPALVLNTEQMNADVAQPFADIEEWL
jgi:hypothetical protein